MIYDVPESVPASLDKILPSKPVSDQLVVEALIDHYAADMTAQDRAKLNSFAKCESGYTQFNTNGTPYLSEYGTPDCGVFQLNKVHWDGKTPATSLVCTSLEENVKAAVALYRKEGSRPWNPSRTCWDKKVPGW